MQTDVDIFETQSDSDKELTCQTIAKFLLQQRYVLTAFELLHELLEDGQLKAASKLQDYFGDQEMFPPDQMVQLQSLKALDTHRLCDEKDMAENRAVFAEKEVEEARNEIRLLEKQLEEKTELCSLIEGLNEEDVENNKHLLKKAISKRALSSKGEFIQNEERKILNFAVKEYLVSAGYKLTAMTFYDEVDQNLDEWPEGKIRVEKTLRTYYHHFYTCINDENELIDLREENKSIKEDKVFFEKEKNVYLNELNEIKKKLLEKDRTIATLEKEKEKIEKESNQIKSELTSFKLRIEQIEKEKNEYLNFVKSMKEENERLMNISKMSIINNHDYNQSKPLDSMETDMNLKNDHSNFSSSSSSLHNMNEVEVVYVNKEEISLNVNDDSLSQKEKEKRMGLIENEEDKVEKKEETKDREEERGEREGEGREEDDGSCDYSKHDGMDGNVNDDNDDIIHKHKNKFNDALNTSNDDDYNDNDVKKSYSFDKNDGEVNEEEMKTIIENTKDEINDKDNDNDKNKDNDNDKDDDDLYCVRIIADSLPKIIPNVLINHREELLPLILCAIERHPDVTTRDQLTHNLFNLIKKPNHEQRAIIMHACMDLACKIGEERTETELLPQCWEQIIHKLPERRLLVSLSCGQLAPFVNYELRSSLILSILQQLCDDPDPIVRESVATNLSVLIPLYKDGEKYSKVEELVFRLICDASGSVVEESLKNLFPVFVKWTKAVKHPLSHFLHSILFHLIENIQNCPPFSTLESTFESNFRILNDNNRRNIISILRMLNKIMHDVFSATLCTWPDSLKRKLRNFVSHYESNEHVQVENASDNITHNAVEDGGEGEGEGEGGGGGGGEDDDPFPLHVLETYSKSDVQWVAFDWLPHNCIPTLLKFVCMLQQREESIKIKLCDVFLTMTQLFGFNYSNTIILPVFLISLDDVIDISYLPSKILNHVNDLRPVNASELKLSKSCILPLLLAGVLASPPLKDRRKEKEKKDIKTNRSLSDYLRHVIISSCLKSGSLNSIDNFDIIDSIRFLCSYDRCHADVLSVLWDLVMNPTPSVRITASVIFQSIISYLDESNVRQRVVPALVTLASDPNIEVKHASISAFGSVAQHFKNESIVEKIKIQMDSFLEDGSHDALLLVFKTLTSSLPLASQTLKEYLLQKLNMIASRTQTEPIHSVRKRQRNEVLCSAVRALEASDLSPSSIKDFLLPSIQSLLKDSDTIDMSDREMLETILKERGGSKFEALTKTLFGKERTFYAGAGGGKKEGLGMNESESRTNESASVSPGPPEESRFRRMMRAKYEDMVKSKSVKSSGHISLI